MARIPLWVGLTVVGLSAMWIALGSQILPSARSYDFLNLYTGASLAHECRFAADLGSTCRRLCRS